MNLTIQNYLMKTICFLSKKWLDIQVCMQPLLKIHRKHKSTKQNNVHHQKYNYTQDAEKIVHLCGIFIPATLQPIQFESSIQN